MKKRVILVHSGRRDDYQIAIALQKFGYLKYLVTDDFILRRRKPRQLNTFIKTSFSALLCTILNKVLSSGRLNAIKDDLLSSHAKRLTRGNKQYIILSYSYYSTVVFNGYKGRKVLFQLHPHPLSVRKIFEIEILNNPASRISLAQEHELLLSDKLFRKLVNEPANADEIIVASGFTKKTLIENGIKENKITVIPYGINRDIFKPRTAYTRTSNLLKVLFVGSVNQRKGLSYLAEAVKRLEEKGVDIELIVVGRGIIDKKLVERYQLRRLILKLDISLEELISIYNASDVFVLPSLCEGFGQVILEAMATGLPVIATYNTAAPDVVEEGREGFVIPIQDTQILMQRLETLYNDPALNITMGKAAAVKAEKLSWEAFGQGIKRVIEGGGLEEAV